jgi:exopolyphosphatase/guanosine-5'-triphosphate,3'-diphosphate pyrophosphatase
MPTAVIDIGTNTLLLLVVDEAMRPILDECRFGRLGRGLDATGRLAPEAIAESLDICREYRRLLDDTGVACPTIVGTQALREATNVRDFIAAAEEILRAPIQIIDGAREAELAFTSVARSFPELAGSPFVVVDVGGGSTEIVATDGARVTAAVSVPIGAVRMTERHLAHDPPTAEEVRALFADIDRQLAHHLAALDVPSGATVVGTAGTATTLAAVALRLRRYDPVAVTGFRLEPSALEAQLARLLGLTVAERRALKGMEPQRADVIAGGVAIYSRIVSRLDAPVLVTADRGVRWGLVYEQAAVTRPVE